MNPTTHCKSIGQRFGPAGLALLLFALAYILPLGARDLISPDETRYAEIPREMIAGHDWVVPHLNGLRYFEKPVLGYWVHALSLLLFGNNNFAVRFPSALAVGLSALLLSLAVWHATRHETDHFPPLLAALVFLTCFGVVGIGNMAVLDNLFSFLLTATVISFYFASEESPGSGTEKGLLLLSGVFCGLAFLTKGFLAFAVPILGLVPYLLWQRRYFDLLRMSWLPILTAVLVAMPWAVFIWQREPDFWRFFFWNEHIRRFLADNAQHRQSFWFFFLTAPLMFLPWATLIPAASRGIRTRLTDPGKQGRLLRLCLCWLALPFFFFSCSRGKLLTYILPCFPPFAVLLALGLTQVTNTKRDGRFQGGIIITAGVCFLLLVALLYFELFGFNGSPPFSQSWKAIMLVNGFVFFLLFCLWAFKSHDRKKKILLFAAAPCFLFFVAHFTIPDQTIELKSPGVLLQKYQKEVADAEILISDEGSIQAVCWYLRRNDAYMLGDPGELEYGLGYQDATGRLLDITMALSLLREHPGKTVLFTEARKIKKWEDMLPKPAFEVRNGPTGYVLRRY